MSYFIERFLEFDDSKALVWNDQFYTYNWLCLQIKNYLKILRELKVDSCSIISVISDYSPYSIALMFAIIQNNCVYVPISKESLSKKDEFYDVAQVEWEINFDKDYSLIINKTNITAKHPLYSKLKSIQSAGLVLFSSGSTGKSKGVVHNFHQILQKFKTIRQKKTILAFLLFDHIGGINTLLYTLSNGGTLITTHSRQPDDIAKLIEKYDVQILPTSPSFCNLLLLNKIFDRYNLSSLELITYGTEVMPEFTLNQLNRLLPNVKLQQTYGLSEIGILSSKSLSNDSLWVKVGGSGFQTRVVDGLLEVKAESAMIGYLNAKSPFTEDGWFKTGDQVEVNGEYIKILGRTSEIINVGGQKVYPSEVENELLKIDAVEDCVVFGEPNPILGKIVCAKVKLSTPQSASEFRKKMNNYLANKIEKFKIPQKIYLVDQNLHGERFKRIRNL